MMGPIRGTLKALAMGVLFAGLALSCTGQDPTIPADDTSNTATTTTSDTLPTYTLSLSAGSGGTVSASPAGPTYTSGTIVTLTASPSSGQEVASWTGAKNEPSTAVTNQVVMSGDKTVSVAFQAIPPTTYTLTLNPGTGGSLSATPTSSSGQPTGTYTSGTVVTLTATANSGYQVNTWSGADVTSPADPTSNTITMSGGNKTVGVTFVSVGTHYTLTYSTPDNWGSLSFAPTGTSVGTDQLSYAAGTQVTVTATAFSGFEYSCLFEGTSTDHTGWTEIDSVSTNGVGSQNIVITMNSDLWIEGFFPFSNQLACPSTGFSK